MSVHRRIALPHLGAVLDVIDEGGQLVGQLSAPGRSTVQLTADDTRSLLEHVERDAVSAEQVGQMLGAPDGTGGSEE